MTSSWTAAILLLAASAVAQEPQISPGPASTRQPAPVNAPSPDEVAPPEAEYAGPSILSRSATPSVGHGGELMRFHPFASVSGVYDTGLATLSTDEQGRLNTTDSYGVDTSFGVTGTRRWRHTLVDLDYRGTFRHYTNNPYYDGMDNMLMLSVQHQVSHRVTLVLQETGGRYARSFFLPMARMSFYDPMLASIGRTEIFDTPTTALISTARLIYQRTARLSFSASGTEFLVRRRSQELVGADGASATGDIAYRLSRFQTIAIEYDFSQFTFKNQFGSSYTHSAALNYSVRLGKNWELQLRGGGFRLEANRTRQVQLDPAVADILGISRGIETFHLVTYLPRYEAQLTRRFRHASVSANYDRTVMPGNSVYLTSGYETGTVSYRYAGIRRVGLGASFGLNRFRSMMQQNLGLYSGWTGTGNFSYSLGHGLSLMASANARQYSINTVDRVVYRGQVGLMWSPGDYPLTLW